jgi:hypothetical protein
MSRAKQAGTLAESAVVRHLIANGMQQVTRRPLTGSSDTGDIWVEGGAIIIEVKSRNRVHSWLEVEAWMDELDREVVNADLIGAKSLIGALVVKRLGSGIRSVGDWHVYLRPDDASYLLSGVSTPGKEGWLATTVDQFADWAEYRLFHRGPYGRLG